MSHEYYIDRDPRPKTHPCRHCGRDVQEKQKCTCAVAERFADKAKRAEEALNKP